MTLRFSSSNQNENEFLPFNIRRWFSMWATSERDNTEELSCSNRENKSSGEGEFIPEISTTYDVRKVKDRAIS